MQARKAHIKPLKTIKSRADFLRAQKHGKRWVSKSVIVQSVPNDDDTQRIGYTVSKKVNKRAVVRNRIKRRLRALACDILPSHAAAGYDYVFIGRAETATRDYKDLKKDLLWSLKRLDLIASKANRNADNENDTP